MTVVSEQVTVGDTKASVIVAEGRIRVFDRTTSRTLFKLDLATHQPEVRNLDNGMVLLKGNGETFRMRPEVMTADQLARSLTAAIAAVAPVRNSEASNPPRSGPDPLLRECSECGRTTTDAQDVYCPQCAAELPNPTVSDVLAHVALLSAQVSDLERRLSLREDSDSVSAAWRWKNVDNDERWTVWWGVAWRGVVAWLCVMLVLAVLATLFSGEFPI